MSLQIDKVVAGNLVFHTHPDSDLSSTTALDSRYLKLSGSLADVTNHSHTILTDIGTNTHSQIDTALTRLANTSGSNTGDQDLSGYLTSSTASSTYLKLDASNDPITGNLLIRSSIDSVSAFEIQDKDSNVIVSTDSVNNRFGLGLASPVCLFHASTSTSGYSPLLYGNNTLPFTPTMLGQISASITSDSTAIVGLNLENSSQTDSTLSPLVTFSRKSASGSYNPIFSAIGGRYVGQGANTNWAAGNLEFFTAPVGGTGPLSRMKIDSAGCVGINVSPPSASPPSLSIGGSSKGGTPMGMNFQFYSPNASVDQGFICWNMYWNGTALTRQNTSFSAVRFTSNVASSNENSVLAVSIMNTAGTDHSVFAGSIDSTGSYGILTVNHRLAVGAGDYASFATLSYVCVKGNIAIGTNYAVLAAPTNGAIIEGIVGIGTSSPTNILSLGGDNARTIWMERHTTANTAGNSLTIQAGGATASSTNKAGGNLILKPGVSTGSGTGSIQLLASPGTAGSTADNALFETAMFGPLEIVLNDTGLGTLDFRVESDTEANMLFVDANGDTDGALYLGGSTNGIKINKGGKLTCIGTATTFKDEIGRLSQARVVSPGSKIIQDDTENAFYYKDSATSSDYLWVNIQLNHDRLLGAALHPHIHWWQTSATIPNWVIQYRYQKQGTTKTTSWTSIASPTHIFTYTSGTLNQITEFADITPTSGDGVSDILQIRIIRDVANALGKYSGADTLTGDVYIVDMDIHKECSQLGSNDEYAM